MGQLYRHLDDWARNLSRARYAGLQGILSAVIMFTVGMLLSESLLVEAVAMGISVAVFYYWFNPDDKD
jgi:hypothetical protein